MHGEVREARSLAVVGCAVGPFAAAAPAAFVAVELAVALLAETT